MYAERERRKRALVQSTESGQLDTQRESDCSKPMKKKKAKRVEAKA
jgi:hypothetical protein